jgi:hypothetical protein
VDYVLNVKEGDLEMMNPLKLTTLLTVACLISAVGCQEQARAPQATPAAAGTEDDHGHAHDGHGAGPHGGTLADWGGGKYHVEFTVDHDKKETIVYVLGSDEKTPAPVKTVDGKMLLTINEPVFQVELQATPLEGENEGMSSRYVGQHENLGIVREFAGSMSAEIDGTPYAGDFKEEPHGAHEHK